MEADFISKSQTAICPPLAFAWPLKFVDPRYKLLFVAPKNPWMEKGTIFSLILACLNQVVFKKKLVICVTRIQD